MATINKIPNCPPLRFPDFDDDWRITTLGEIAGLVQTRRKATTRYLSVESFLPNFGGVQFAHNETNNSGVAFEVDDVLMSNIRPYLRKVWRSNCSGACSSDVLVFRCGTQVISQFLYSIIANQAFIDHTMQGAKGVKMPRGDKQQMKSYPISLPSLAEQKKIAGFLSLIDERINNLSETLRELKNQKAALLNQLFSQKLRFPDFDDEWTQTTLGEILLEESERNSKNINRVISSTINGLFDQKEYFNRDIASKDISNYKILKRNQLVLSPQNIWMGNINVNLRFDVGIVSPSYKIYSLDHDSIDFRFASYALKTPIMLQRYKDSSSQGASVVRRNLDIDSFYSVTLPLPSLEEQKKIADFLSLIDERIEAEEQLLKKYEEQKKYLLRNMFV